MCSFGSDGNLLLQLVDHCAGRTCVKPGILAFLAHCLCLGEYLCAWRALRIACFTVYRWRSWEHSLSIMHAGGANGPAEPGPQSTPAHEKARLLPLILDWAEPASDRRRSSSPPWRREPW